MRAMMNCLMMVAVAALASCGRAPDAALPVVSEPPIAANFDPARGVTFDSLAKYKLDANYCFTGGSAPVILGAVTRPDDTTIPAIATRSSAGWTVAYAENLHGLTWAYGGSSEARHEWWGVLNAPDGKSNLVTLVKSADDGKTWQTTCAIRTVTEATVGTFQMSDSGVGKLVMQLDDDISDTLRAGRYSYQSNDHGATWTGPTYEPDNLIAADATSDTTMSDAAQAIDADQKK
jgi:hypothetical protein